MLKVTVELFPFGDETRRKTISTFDIANDGKGSFEKGNYIFRSESLTGGTWSKTLVSNHDRKEDVERLIMKVLNEFYAS